MSFIHEHPEFPALVSAIERETGVDAALVEKDYWITHSLWALHETRLSIWFKGGTSLSKGFGIIERFSEDLDLMIEPGGVAPLPEVTSWTSTNKGPTSQRRAFYDTLPALFEIPDVCVEIDPQHYDKYARGADYIGRYPGTQIKHLPAAMSPFIRFEVGRARVLPFVTMPLSSFVHDHLSQLGVSADYADNRPKAVRCVHPIVTLFEKIDALSRRFDREPIEPDTFVRHYEDAAHIIHALPRCPPMEVSALQLMDELAEERTIHTRPSPESPCLLLDDPKRRSAVARSYEKIAPMFWGPRVPLDQACAVIRTWIRRLRV